VNEASCWLIVSTCNTHTLCLHV